MSKKVYISGALMGARDLGRARELYEIFASACRDAGWIPYLPHSNTDPDAAATLPASTVVSRDLEELESADVLLAYLGEPSLGVGAEIALAVCRDKPILATYESGRRISRFVLGLLECHRSAAVFEFRSEREACEWIKASLALGCSATTLPQDLSLHGT